MVAPFGFGISDFVAVGQLAWKVYASCEAAPEVFGSIRMELKSMHCVLDEAAETQLSHPLPLRRQARLKTILDGCNSVLADLQYIVQKYQSLGTDDKSTWDRLRLGGEDISEIRSRLVFNITLLTAFRRFALRLKSLVDIADELNASLVIGTTTSEAQPPLQREFGSWQWVVELSGPDGVESPRRSTPPSIYSRSYSRTESETTTLVDVQRVDPSPPRKPKSRPRLAALTTGFSSRKKRLISIIESKNVIKALNFLNEDLTTDILDQELLDHALWSAARFPSTPLMQALLERGANVNAVHNKKTVLWNAVNANNEDAVYFLLSKKVNQKIEHRDDALSLRAALRSEPMMTLLARGGVVLDTEYEVATTVRLNILQEAVSHGRESITQILLNNGAKVDACSSSNGTALMIALSMGRESIAKLLIQKGANVNATRSASESCSYTNPIEAALLGRKPSLLELLFRAGAVTDMPQAMRFAQANSEYPLIPTPGSQYGYDYDGTRKFYVVMSMLAQRDLRYVLFFRKDDKIEVKREGIRKMMIELCK